MFSGQTFGQFAFAEQVDDPIDSAAWLEFLAAIRSPRCWLVEIDAFALGTSTAGSGAFMDGAFGERSFADSADAGTSGTTTLRFSTHGYTSQAADDPVNTWYEGRLNVPKVDRRIIGKDGIGGLTEVFAEISLVNQDGALDSLLDDYAIDGRQVRIKVGALDAPLSEFGLVFTGVCSVRPVIGTTEVQIRLSDGGAKLSSKLWNETTYAGSGGLEGGADLTGKPKPFGYGSVLNISPPLVDSSRDIYQIQDGLINDVPNAWDRQVALTQGADYADTATMNSTPPAAGYYRVCKTASGSYIRLGSTPSGTLTCNAELDASGAGYIDNLSDIVLRILNDRVGLTSSEIEPASFEQLGIDVTAEIGIWRGAEVDTCDRVTDELLQKCGSFGGFNRQGAFSVGLVALPSGSQHETFNTIDILELTREPLPEAVSPIVWFVSVAYQRNYTIQPDLDSSVAAARRTFAAEEYRYSISNDVAIQTRHLLARQYGAGGLYAQSADADAEALRLFTLWGTQRGTYRVKTRPKAMTCDLGKVVQITHPRHGFANGKTARVLAHKVDGAEVEMLVLC